jgi:hypothetical protein
MHLALYVPGLLEPGADFTAEEMPQAPALEFLLARGRRRTFARQGYHRALMTLFGYELSRHEDVPVAAVCRLVDAAERPDGIWVRADPVHLHADNAGLLLTDAELSDLSVHDALALAAAIRPLLSASGCDLEVPHPSRWYARIEGIAVPRTRAPEELLGRPVRDALPRGDDAGRWHALLNGIQMQLHDCEINRERGRRGERPVNSVWFWGAGPLPSPIPGSWSRVHADDLFVQGLARLSHVDCVPLGNGPGTIAGASQRVLAVLPQCRNAALHRDTGAWNQALAALEAGWFTPCLDMLGHGDLKSIDIITDRMHARTSRIQRHFLWRRPQRLHSYIHGE